MHNNIMAAGSKERPPMLGPGRYSQWHSRFLRYLDTKSNGEYLTIHRLHPMMRKHGRSTFANPKYLKKAQSEKLVFQASVFMAMMSVHISSGLVLHQMTSDHNRSELRIHDHSNEPSSSKLVPKVVPLAVKTATSRKSWNYYSTIIHSNAKDNRVILFSIHNDEWKSFQCHHQTALRMSMLVKDIRSQDGKDDKDNDKGSKSRSQSMKEQGFNKERRTKDKNTLS
ncbi:hypothetical protein Tco_0525089 [Tanacetum coccineum]